MKNIATVGFECLETGARIGVVVRKGKEDMGTGYWFSISYHSRMPVCSITHTDRIPYLTLRTLPFYRSVGVLERAGCTWW